MANAILIRMNPDNTRFIHQNNLYSSSELIQKLESSNFISDDWEKHLLNFLVNWFLDTNSIELKTSGSTGTPKLIRTLKSNLRLSAQSTNRFFKITPASRLISCLPANFIAGKMMIIRALEAGCQLHLIKPESNPFQQIQTEADFIAVTPHQLNQAISQKSTVDRVKNILIGGERITAKLLDSISKLKSNCYASFGMTETLSHIAVQSLNHPFNPAYRTLNGVKISQDERSCLVIEAPWVEKSITTNDLVEMINEQEFRWLGRLDDVINSGGIKLHPASMEEKLVRLFDKRICISSLNDQTFGEIPVLIIENKGRSEPESSQLLDKLNSLLDVYEKLKGIFHLQEFPETESGKINRREIKKRINQSF